MLLKLLTTNLHNYGIYYLLRLKYQTQYIYLKYMPKRGMVGIVHTEYTRFSLRTVVFHYIVFPQTSGLLQE